MIGDVYHRSCMRTAGFRLDGGPPSMVCACGRHLFHPELGEWWVHEGGDLALPDEQRMLSERWPGPGRWPPCDRAHARAVEAAAARWAAR